MLFTWEFVEQPYNSGPQPSKPDCSGLDFHLLLIVTGKRI